ncbi:MAG: neutral/alkaline non-lysosomal ceramidase N-terminal domain-containing protein [Gammaproteobacteria bacterium]|nr:neutral/alkaline non-lysosomal ceramidase N-terminal domain-containing protein [Gammaproteobacteria bacterium]
MLRLRLFLASSLALCFFVLPIKTLCGESRSRFRAGAATMDITPKRGVSLDGPISKNGPVTGVHDRLHARALMLDDGKTRLAIVICDACMIGRDVFDAAKKMVQDATDLPAGRMLMAATHTHAAVRAVHIGTKAEDGEYHKFLARRIADAVIQARDNLAPAQIGFGSFDNPDFVRCRRFLCRPGSVVVNPFGESGERIKSVAGRSSAVIKPAGPVDPQFSVLSVQHADGDPLAVLGNFSVHYCGGYRRGLVSADYFGHYAQALESHFEAGKGRPTFVGIMSNGTSGDTGSIERGGKGYPAFEWMEVSARILADKTQEVIGNIEHRNDVALASKESEITLAVRRPDEKRLKWAHDVLANPDGPHPHQWSKVYAQEAFHLSKYPETKTIKLQALRIGDVAIAAMPCEVFAETGLAIKKDSPHQFTFSIELANGYGGYLPPREQHELGGYETWPARSSFLEVDAESRIRTEALRLLREITVKRGANLSPPHPVKSPTSALMLNIRGAGADPTKINSSKLPRECQDP